MRNTSSALLIAVALLPELAGCASVQTSERISAAELRRLVPGATLAGTVAAGGMFEGTYFRDHTMAIRTGLDSDTGTWEFEGDTVCLTWRKWREGERYCIYWERTPTGYASRFPDGRLSTTFRIVE
jgi:hypothetical protein